VRVLDAKGVAAPIQIIDSTNALGNRTKRLVISRSNVAAPDFKILLFPHLAGDALPTTTWSNNFVTVTMADGQTDRIYFNTNSDGRTRVQSYRVTGQGALPAIPSLTATGGVAQVALNWSASPGATGYNLRVSSTNGGPYSIIASNIFGTAYTNTSLIPGTNYFYTITTLNTNGESEMSPQVSATPLALPSAPPLIGCISISGTNLIVSGTNGVAGSNYFVLTATNIALPLTNWAVVATNQFGAGGGFRFTNSLSAASYQLYYLLKLP
jgi:hypothetical protein